MQRAHLVDEYSSVTLSLSLALDSAPNGSARTGQELFDYRASRQELVLAFGSFRLLTGQRLLLEADRPLRLGSRALEILMALLERPGELIGKNELLARVWPNLAVVEDNLTVHVAALRRVLGDGM